MKVAILGGTRFIGPAVVRQLVAQGREVEVYHRGKSNCALPEGVRHVHIDRDIPGQTAAALVQHRPDAVIDLCGYHPHHLEEVVRADLKLSRYVFCSSTAVYGQIFETLPDELTRTQPKSDYEIGKVACENLLLIAHAHRGFPAAIARLGHPYGPLEELMYSTGRDSLFIVNVWQHGHAFKNGVVLPNAPDAPFVRAATLNGAATGIRAIVEGSGVSSSNYGEIREETACVVAGNTVRSPRLVPLNRWSAQLVVLNIDSLVKGSPALELNRIVTTVPLAASQSVLRPNSLVAKHLEIACGDELALISIRAYDDSASRLATGAHMVVVVPGMREHGVRFIDSSFVPALGSLKAAHGQSFFFGHDSRFGYPQVVEVRLQLKTIHWLVSQSLRLPRRL